MRLVLESALVKDTPARPRREVRGAPIRTRRIRVLGEARNTTNAALVASWRRLGFAAELIQPGKALGTLGPEDIVVSRLDILPGLDGVEPGLLELLLLERRGVPVINSSAALLGVHDKLRTARLLSSARVPHPRTELVTGTSLRPSIEPPLVIKPRFGSWGRHVYCCRSDAAVTECLDAIARTRWFARHGAIAQELIPPCGRDLRILIANGRVVGAARRVAAPGEWRTNVSLGGSLGPTALSDEIAELARTAAAAVDADFAGVDLLPTADGYVVLELNGAVDFDGRYSLAGRDVFADAAHALDLPASPARGTRRGARTRVSPTTSLSRKERS